MTLKSTALLGIGLLVSSGQAASANSIVVPDAVWSAFVLTQTGQNQSNPQSFSSPLSNYTQASSDGWGGKGLSTVSTSATPALTVRSTITSLGSNPSGHATAPFLETRANLYYSIAIVGPSGPNVSLTVSGNGAASTPNNPNASAEVFLGLSFSRGSYTRVVGANVIENTIQNDGSRFTDYMTGPVSGFTYAHTFTAPVNSIINVSMSVLADDSGAPLLSSSYAYLDPFFSVSDGRYTILTSPGILNEVASAVPEPSTWAMLLLGFFGIGCLSYRRRTRPQHRAA